ncbi:hypothetical protein P5G50_08930 [Leifsonia sp. F6_8S_P_1B]|uniref:Uncharacterized protein n=1 Tax=Leifsonia williamsii TaxID=3035919 RepID=A0ABT8KAW7_9MICO|nr:hypothetical protein [Leifsonia williamsii]MDN4614575.1 hypothetical protein [Leifsonia williamsii]
MTGQWKSQTFDAEGSSTASGILRQLGRPSLDEFTILVREAAQNSWDARRGDSDVHFAMRLQRLGDRSEAWKDLLLPGPPARSIDGFDAALAPDSWQLIISDRGTQGLAGPIRATQRPRVGEKNDFVQFLRNVGEPRDTVLGGGTYGFGKGIFYRTSRVRTILADSRVLHGSRHQRRLMGAALGDDLWEDGSDVRLTGRHWWGRLDGDVVDPLLDDDADVVARALGLPEFEADATGTNIVVLAADLELGGISERRTNPTAIGVHLASAILWNLWPKFRAISASSEPAMTFSVHVEDEAIPIPSPTDVLGLRPFAESFKLLGGGDKRTYNRTSEPRIHVGDLVVRTGLAEQIETPVIASARPFDGPAHHVVRMRQAGLVVDYFEGPPHPDPLFCYGGVFRASSEADEFFAAAEPPTHDRWNPEGLDKSARAVVDGAKRWIRDAANRQFAMSATPKGNGSRGLGHGSRRLSRLVAGLRATGADPIGIGGVGRGSARNGEGRGTTSGAGRTGDGTGPGRRPQRARLEGDPWVQPYEGSLGVFTRVRVEDPASVTAVRARLDVVLDGGSRESAAPRGAFTPQVLGWYAATDSSINQAGDTVTALRGVQDWVVVAQFSDAAVTRFRLEVEDDTDVA